ncbi:hypothetical protein BrevBR_07845 [Brevundimonas sp. BR2-1]|uniref:hypothetical protein n=1 Tax=Brevundimonas sp. BR2-1 TaxID=3031123 RepID=UPI0030A53CE9
MQGRDCDCSPDAFIDFHLKVRNPMHQKEPSFSLIPWLAFSAPLLGLIWLIVRAQIDPITTWLVANDELSGWAQAIGALAALASTAYISGVEGRRSRRALEAQAAIQREVFEHQVRQELGAQKAKRDAALSAVKAAFLFYEKSLASMNRIGSYAAFKRAYENDWAVSKSLISNVSYEHLISSSDMLRVSSMNIMFGDIDRAIDKLVAMTVTDLHTKYFYNYLCKSKIRACRQLLVAMGVDLDGFSFPSELEFTREDLLAAENSDGSEWGPDGTVVPNREPRSATPNLI